MNKNRFWNELRWVAALKRKQTLGVMGVIFLASTAVAFFMMAGIFNDNTPVETRAENTAMIASLLDSLIAIYCFVTIFGPLNDKSNQVCLLTAPASNAEKFFARMLYLVFQTLVAINIGEISGLLAGTLLSGEPLTGSLLPHLLGADMQSYNAPAMNASMYFTGLTNSLWMMSCYVLGNLYFRKHSFILTTVIIFAVTIGISMCIGILIGYYCHQFGTNWPTDLWLRYRNEAVVFIGMGLVALFCVNLLWGYRKFCRLQFKNL
ncbi:MAG: hypothetical protein IJV27_11865 [Prevotella sp.]|nr:hypothetical protein [Prevotella sp.]